MKAKTWIQRHSLLAYSTNLIIQISSINIWKYIDMYFHIEIMNNHNLFF